MLIDSSEVEKRLNSPLNLLNRLKSGELKPEKKNAMDLFIPPKERVEIHSFRSPVKESSPKEILPVVSQPSLPQSEPTPTADELLDDVDSNVKLASAHNNALDLLTEGIGVLRSKLANGDVKASSIPSIISSASKVITDIRKERLERESSDKDRNVHYHFYSPVQRSIESYEVIDVEGQEV